MKNLMIVAALALVSLSAVACSPAENGARPATTTASSAGMGLDGKTYSVVSDKLPDGSTFGTDLTFVGGQLKSSACTQLGYAPGKYESSREGNVITFRAEMKKGAETEVWTGRIDGDAINATVTGADGKKLAWHGRVAN